MRQIGKEVLFLPTSETNPRNGEGAMIRLRDRRIMYAYTRYCGDDWGDHATAGIAAYYSSDEGESWESGGVIVKKGENDLNIMSVSLLRMQNGDLGLFYLRKSMKGEDLLCMPYLVRSSDEGKTFGAPVCCATEDGYYCVNNDRAVRLSSGRILLPAAYHGRSGYKAQPGVLKVFRSDDDGLTWESSGAVCSLYSDCIRLQEPGVYELPDRRVWMWCRTAYGHQYQCFSSDGGESFGAVSPALRFSSPDSPMQVRGVGKYAIAVFNPEGYTCLRESREVWKSPKRTPLVCALSRDGGLSFVDGTSTSANGGFDGFIADCRSIESDRSNSYCYPAVLEVDDGFLVSYYHSNGTEVCLNSTKITKIYFDEIDKR